MRCVSSAVRMTPKPVGYTPRSFEADFGLPLVGEQRGVALRVSSRLTKLVVEIAQLSLEIRRHRSSLAMLYELALLALDLFDRLIRRAAGTEDPGGEDALSNLVGVEGTERRGVLRARKANTFPKERIVPRATEQHRRASPVRRPRPPRWSVAAPSLRRGARGTSAGRGYR